MTTFAQHPNTATSGTPSFVVEDPNTRQYEPARYSQQQMPSHRQLAPHPQAYPPRNQQYQQPGYAYQSDQQSAQMHACQRPVYPAGPPYGPTAGETYHAQQVRPALDHRYSQSSFQSARTHKSTRSADSDQSQHSTRSHKSSRAHRSHHSHRSTNDEFKDRRKKRELDARPTMGDSVMLVVNHFRDMLSSDTRSRR